MNSGAAQSLQTWFESLLGGCHLRQLGVDSFKAVKNLSELPLGHLEHDLLVLFVAAARLVLHQVHFDVEYWLLDAVFLTRGYLHVHAPVEIAQLGQRCEFVLQVHLRGLRHLAHHLEQKRLDFLREVLRELRCQLIFVLHRYRNVLLEQCMEGQYEDEGFLIGDV